jgi:integration host factor subunit beta
MNNINVRYNFGGFMRRVILMTRSDLIYRLAALHKHLSIKDVELSVKTIVDAVSQSLSAGNRIEIRGFGVFTLNYRPARSARNPKTGAAVHVPAKYVPHFKAGKDLRERVDHH